MKEIVVISGKGGTGKTVITSSFAVLAKNKVMADCDVDAANLYLLLHPQIRERNTYRGSHSASIDSEICTGCGKCKKVCRFEAIYEENGFYEVDSYSCEGCGACKLVCPVEAVRLEEEETGEWFISETEYGLFVHANLDIAQENSGKLVSLVREKARDIAIENNLDTIIIDGPPGIGCPVIASLSGVNTALVVAEPSLSGIHDMERVIEVAFHFGAKVFLCINKFDINMENTANIEQYALNRGIEVVGKIPYDEKVIDAVRQEVPVINALDGEIPEVLAGIWERIK